MTASLAVTHGDTTAPAGVGPGKLVVPLAVIARASDVMTAHVQAELDLIWTFNTSSATNSSLSAGAILGGGTGGFLIAATVPAIYSTSLARLRAKAARLVSSNGVTPAGGEFRSFLFAGAAAPTMSTNPAPTDCGTAIDMVVGAGDAANCVAAVDTTFDGQNLFSNGAVGFGGPAVPYEQQSFPVLGSSVWAILTAVAGGYNKQASEIFTLKVTFDVVLAA